MWKSLKYKEKIEKWSIRVDTTLLSKEDWEMSVRYNDDFKREVVRAYMTGNKSTVELSAEYNVAKSTISEWAKKYGEECQYKNTT